MENKSFKINCGTYPLDIYVFFSSKDYMFEELTKVTDEESVNAFKKLMEHKTSGGGFLHDYVNNTSVIHLFTIPKNFHDLAWLQHEILHGVFQVHRTIGMKLCLKSEESYCYLLDYLTTQIYKELNLIFTYS